MSEAAGLGAGAPREWRFYIGDMISFAERVLAYTDGLDQEGFVSSGLNYDATLRNLELIGEAATHIPEEVRSAHGEIPWRMIVATRNRLIHGYLGIDNDTLWSIIQDEVPELLSLLIAMNAKLRI
ncbi:DUF86 domain-containing protein [Hylemonella sp. W303a]|uniref:HepT-like ribonuclease domain-containing protein n=1 Tax=Hylemonella sp. W303a TaxID=3389873 RepID=UPI00396B1C0F